MSESAILVRNVEVSAADPVQPMASGEEAPIDLPEFDVPPMRIVVLLVGTQGDVMPFIDIAHRLKERYGHVVRIASHGDLRAPVEKAGLRFYPLEGNARQMAGWGPSFSLQPVTLMKLAANPATTTKLMVLRRVIQSTIRACTEPDPADADAEPFHADVIMSNPMSLGHIHCAEALGVPLHLFFPNPWVATTEYPHSFSGWRYPSTPSSTSPTGYEWTRHKSSFFSYRIVDSVLWHTFLPYVNELRASCRLRTLRVGFPGGTIIADQRVPFSQMWSPTLSPRPHDWADHVTVAGFFFWDQKASDVDEASPEFAPLVAWLAAGEKPIYIGFGSMVFPGLKTARLIVEAAALSGQRVLMQTATAGGDLGALAASELPPNVFHIGRCPHDWLLPKMAAVVHHGGAGTVGAGLNLGLPTLCCPFFGDQFFYAHAVAARKAGPPPIPFEALTAAKLGRALADLCDPSYAEHARRVMEGIRAENGLEGGLADFNRHLPLRDMVCDVSTLLGERCLGRHYYPSLRIKVSDEVHKTLASSAAVDRRLLDGARPHATREWRLGGHVRGPCSGALTGALAFVWELLDGVISLVSLPIKSACYHPVSCVHGFVLGAVAALVLVVLRLLYAPIICLDRFATGFANCCTPAGAGTATYDGAAKPVDHVLDPEPALTAISQAARGKPMCSTDYVRADGGHADGASRLPLHGPVAAAEGARRAQIETAFTRVVALRRAFDALDAPSNDDLLSVAEVATLRQATADGPSASSGGGDASSPIFAADRMPALARLIDAYMTQKGKAHVAFAEFVLLCRHFA